MREINLFCFGFGQVAREFVNKILGQKIKINLITTSRQKSAELNFLNLKYKNFYFDENNFDSDLLNEVERCDYILVSTPPANQKDLFLDLILGTFFIKFSLCFIAVLNCVLGNPPNHFLKDLGDILSQFLK